MSKILLVIFLLAAATPARAMRRILNDEDLAFVRRSICETGLVILDTRKVLGASHRFLKHHSHSPFTLSVREFTHGHRSVPDLVRRGATLESALKKGSGNLDHIELYDAETGHLKPPPQQVTLASESGSQTLDMVRMHYHEEFETLYGHVSTLHLADMRRVLEHLPYVRLLITFSKKAQTDLFSQLEEWPNDLRARVRTSEVDFHSNSIWAQDWSKPLVGDSCTLCGRSELKHYSRPEFHELITLHETPVKFDGGNVVVGDRHVFVAGTVVDDVVSRFWVPRRAARTHLERVFGKPVIELFLPWTRSETKTVTFHLDLDLAIVRDWTAPAPAHREVALVPSPFALARILLGVPVEPLLGDFPDLKARSVERFDAYRRAAIERLPAPETATLIELSTRALLQSLDPHALALEMLKYRYYRTALERAGYAVVEVPGTGAHAAALDDSEGMQIFSAVRATLPFYNYTNLILSGKTALVPAYGIEALDAPAHRVLRDLGYDVLPMHSAAASMCRNGGIRCLSETYRKPWSDRSN